MDTVILTVMLFKVDNLRFLFLPAAEHFVIEQQASKADDAGDAVQEDGTPVFALSQKVSAKGGGDHGGEPGCHGDGKKNVELDSELRCDSDPADQLIKAEEYRALYHALSLLQSNYKEVLVLYYFEGMSVKEISAITGDSTDSVKVTMHRARQKLKSLLEARI